MQEAPSNVELNPQIMIRTLQNTVAQQAVAMAQYQAAVEQLNQEKSNLLERIATFESQMPIDGLTADSNEVI